MGLPGPVLPRLPLPGEEGESGLITAHNTAQCLSRKASLHRSFTTPWRPRSSVIRSCAERMGVREAMRGGRSFNDCSCSSRAFRTTLTSRDRSRVRPISATLPKMGRRASETSCQSRISASTISRADSTVEEEDCSCSAGPGIPDKPETSNAREKSSRVRIKLSQRVRTSRRDEDKSISRGLSASLSRRLLQSCKSC